MKTNIKMRVNPEQSKRVQEICFENVIEWRHKGKTISFVEYPYLFITEELYYADDANVFNGNGIGRLEDINPDLFIRTNGSCEETYNEKYVKDHKPKDLESALKKIENLHIALNKKIEKNKLQASEITLLLKQKEELKEQWNNESIRADKTLIIANEIKEELKQERNIKEYLAKIGKELKEENERLKVTSDINNVVNLNKEIDRLNFIIKYLEGRLNEK